MKSESCAESPRAHSFPCKRGGGGEAENPLLWHEPCEDSPILCNRSPDWWCNKEHQHKGQKKKNRGSGASTPQKACFILYSQTLAKNPPPSPHCRPLLVGAHRATTVEASRCPVNSPVIPVSPFRRCPTTKKSKCLHFPHLVPTDHHTGRRIII